MSKQPHLSRSLQLLGLAGAALLGAITAFLIVSSMRARPPASAEEGAAARAVVPSPSADGEELARLQRELARVQASVQKLSQASAESRGQTRSAASAGEGALPAVPAEPASRAERIAKIEAEFAQESDDPHWQPEADLHTKIGEILPAGSTLRALECRSSMCRWEVEYADMESYQEFANDLLLAQTTQPWLGAATFDVRASQDGEEVVVLAYLNRSAR